MMDGRDRHRQGKLSDGGVVTVKQPVAHLIKGSSISYQNKNYNSITCLPCGVMWFLDLLSGGVLLYLCYT
jgi:hypothetical protein